MNKKMAAYCRVSTEKDEQLASLENQREFFTQYAAERGDELTRLYADEGISGKSIKNRVRFMQMLDDAAEGYFDYVAVKDVSRFARNTSDFLYGIRRLRENGVDVIFISGGRAVGGSEFVLTIFAALAQEESANLSKRVIFGKRQNAKKGRVPNCVYGYDKTGTFTMAPNPRESDIVRLMFKWCIDGDGSRRIAARLNEMGIPTKKNAKWVPKSVRRILANPVYTGRLINNKTVTNDFLLGTRRELPEEEWFVHDRPELRIISDSDFALANAALEERRRKYESGGAGRWSSAHIFSNLIKCGECGRSFTARAYGNAGTRVRYRCRAHCSLGDAHCRNSVTADENELIGAVKKYLISLAEGGDKFKDKLVAELKKPRASNEAALSDARDRLLLRRGRYAELYAAGLIEMRELKEKYRETDSAICRLDAELDRSPAPDTVSDPAKIIEAAEFTNADMRALVEDITVYPDKTVLIRMK